MNWLDTITYILYGCGVLIILLFAVNPEDDDQQ